MKFSTAEVLRDLRVLTMQQYLDLDNMNIIMDIIANITDYG